MSPTPHLHDLWQHLHDEHGLVLVESELAEIYDVCQLIALREAPVEVGPPEEEQASYTIPSHCPCCGEPFGRKEIEASVKYCATLERPPAEVCGACHRQEVKP